MAKEDELVLCINKGIIEAGKLAGMEPRDTILKAVKTPGVAWFGRRGDVETDEDVLQVIPYVTVVAPVKDEASGDNYQEAAAKVLLYQRGSKGGEKRLENQYSIGFGGHVNIDDAQDHFLDSTDSSDTMLDVCMNRELTEELGLAGGINCDVFLSNELIQDTSNPVGRVHIGVHYMMILHEMPEIKAENTIAEIKWVDFADIFKGGQYYDKLETWSQIVADNVKQAHDSCQEAAE